MTVASVPFSTLGARTGVTCRGGAGAGRRPVEEWELAVRPAVVLDLTADLDVPAHGPPSWWWTAEISVLEVERPASAWSAPTPRGALQQALDGAVDPDDLRRASGDGTVGPLP